MVISRFWMLLSLLLIGVGLPVGAQESLLDTLPDCNFTASSGLDNLVVGAVVLDVASGRGCAENLDTVFQAASVPKIFIAGAYYDWVARELASPNTPITFTQDYLMGGRSACLSSDDVGTTYRLDELVDLMITCSDNAATWMVMDALGWGRVQEYIDSLGIPGIGPVIPYSDVDRRKLALVDPTWNDIPRGMASRYYRRGWTDGLDRYFETIPFYGCDRFASRNCAAFIEANAQYIAETDTNTITPRAMASYLLKLITDANTFETSSLVAARQFNTLLGTQRQHSVQSFPGTVMVGAKNGFDMGVRAEVNVIFTDTRARVPSAIAIFFTQQPDFYAPGLQMPTANRDSLLPTYLRGISPQVADMLFPNPVPPTLGFNVNVSAVLFQEENALTPCWIPYRESDYAPSQVDTLESCWQTLGTRQSVPAGGDLGIGVILRRLDANDFTRVVLVFTAPDGRRYSYQTFLEFRERAGIYWLHPLDQVGAWQMDIFINLEWMYTASVQAY